MENKLQKLYYDVHSYSSFSSSYLPENIRDDLPSNQISRWSSETNTPAQFITLKLTKPSIVKYIKFGKYEKPHVCNLKKMKILGGMDLDNMSQMFEGGLKNDSVPETFELKHKNVKNENFPVLYISVLPLLSYGPSFNFSIWYIELLGVDDDLIISETLHSYIEKKEKITMRLILKHLRDRSLLQSFEALSKETQILLEDSEITDLYNCLISDGNFEKVELIMQKLIEEGNDIEYISRQTYKAVYNEIVPNTNNCQPETRNYAAYAFDDTNSLMFMFGGFCDQTELNDLWTYNVAKNQWSVENYNGLCPSPRAGAKMIFDPIGNQIFLIGRKSMGGYENFKSDFYLFDLTKKCWLLICEDTSVENGPQCVSDHQLCMSQDLRTLYLFGGKISNRTDENFESYCDFYSYHINNNTWSRIFVDCGHPLAANPEITSIKSRIKHSMLYDNKNNFLYIFGGERGKEKFAELLKIDVDRRSVTTINAETDVFGTNSTFGHPLATIDEEKDEIHVISSENVHVFSLTTREWTKTQKNPANPLISIEFAAFDRSFSRHVILKSGKLYSLQLKKPSRENILSLCKYLIRKQKYEEIAILNPLEALNFLQNNLAETINQSDQEQVDDFHKLASLLFLKAEGTSSMSNEEKNRHQRTLLFNKLIEVLPDKKCQPRQNLWNFINM